MPVNEALSDANFPLGRAWLCARDVRELFCRLRAGAPPPLNIVDDHLLEICGDGRAAQGRRLLAVDEDRCGRLLASARQRDADISMLTLPRSVDDAAHHRN